MGEYASLFVARNGEKLRNGGVASFWLYPIGYPVPLKIIEGDRVKALRLLLNWALENEAVSVDGIQRHVLVKKQYKRVSGNIRDSVLDLCRYYCEEGYLSKSELLGIVREVEKDLVEKKESDLK